MDDKEKVQVQALRDQAWAELRELKDDILRIAKEGPTSLRDAAIAQKVLLVVAGDLEFREDTGFYDL